MWLSVTTEDYHVLINSLSQWMKEIKMKKLLQQSIDLLIQFFKIVFVYKYFVMIKKKNYLVFYLKNSHLKKQWFSSEIWQDYFHISNWYTFNCKLFNFERIHARNMKVIHAKLNISFFMNCCNVELSYLKLKHP